MKILKITAFVVLSFLCLTFFIFGYQQKLRVEQEISMNSLLFDDNAKLRKQVKKQSEIITELKIENVKLKRKLGIPDSAKVE